MSISELNAFLESLPKGKRKKYERMARELLEIQQLPPAFVLDYIKDWMDPSTWEPIIEFRKAMRLSRIAQGAREYPCVKGLIERGFESRMRGRRNILLYNVLQVLRRLRLSYNLDDILRMNRESASPLPQAEVERTYYYHLKERPKRGRGPYGFQCRPFQDVGLCDENCWRLRREIS